jgi:hypothetical protein
MSQFTSQDEARRLGVNPDTVTKAGQSSLNNVPGADYDVSKPVGATKALFPFGGMPRS